MDLKMVMWGVLAILFFIWYGVDRNSDRLEKIEDTLDELYHGCKDEYSEIKEEERKILESIGELRREYQDSLEDEV